MKRGHRPAFWLLAVWLAAAAAPGGAAAEASAAGGADDTIAWTVKASSTAEYATHESVADRALRRELERAAGGSAAAAEPAAAVRVELLDTFIAWKGSSSSVYAVDEDGSVLDVTRRVKLPVSDKRRRELLATRDKLRQRHYGALLPWSEANTQLPRMAKYDLTDVETGLTFRVQRRAGSSHADMQPLTKQDSAIMKQAFGGKWSWDRRAVIVRYEDRLYAASMNGKPHGGDGIPGNEFNGHFCVHYAGSKTHGKKNLDLAHQAMVHKAAGQLGPFLRSLTPYQIADLFLIALNQHDVQLLSATRPPGLQGDPIPEDLRNVKKAQRGAPLQESSISSEQRTVEYNMQATLHENSTRAQHRTLRFVLAYDPVFGSWYVDAVEMGKSSKRKSS